MPLMADIHRLVDEIAPALAELRRELHTIPERGFGERKTAARIERELEARKIGRVRRLGDTGLVCDIAGARAEPVVALRADIDALPIVETDNRPHRSTHEGVMHACGHDGHAAILVGAGQVLKQLADRLPGSARLVFQPAEEGGGGANELCRLGVMADPTPVAVFALHGNPESKLGKIVSAPGAFSASTDVFEIAVEGSSAHGAYPHLGRDAVCAASAVVLALQQIVARRVKPFDAAVVTVGKIEGGTADNIVAPKVTLLGTIRARDAKVRKRLNALVKSVARDTAKAWGCTARVDITKGYPIVENDPACVELVRETAEALGGPKTFAPTEDRTMGGEDFSYFLQHAPGCMFRLGLRDRDHAAGLHTTEFDFNDKAIPLGVATMAGVVCRRLGLELD